MVNMVYRFEFSYSDLATFYSCIAETMWKKLNTYTYNRIDIKYDF
jgi:hypothetical protein